ncbi:unnamed protein product [Rotaria sp. Silwood1]|nr:unnamed protein product [Rotaria sp. Silwood1]
MHYELYSFIFAVFWTLTIVHGQTSICWSNPCRYGGTCLEINGNTDYVCYCPPNLPVGGKNCDQVTTITTTLPTTPAAVSSCSSNPCLNGATCSISPFTNSYFCTCNDFTYGTRCENLNRCLTHPSPCQNSGACVPGLNSAYSCSCTPQYTGTYCETFIQPISICASAPCLNGGTCLALNDNTVFYCQCPAGFSGSRCVCSPSPCRNGGTCLEINNAPYCHCLSSYTGATCEQIISKSDSLEIKLMLRFISIDNNMCISTPNICRNGGTCQSVGSNEFSCKCMPGYTGVNCETVITVNLCLQANLACLNGGVCTLAGNTYRCSCPTGFTGQYCETAVTANTPCNPSPCKNGATCQPVGSNGFNCQCMPGYTGINCETATTANLCLQGNPACLNGGVCQLVGSNGFRCQCMPGYTGINCETATTANLCLQGNPACLNGGVCTLSGNTYRCSCPIGFTGQYCETAVTANTGRIIRKEMIIISITFFSSLQA